MRKKPCREIIKGRKRVREGSCSHLDKVTSDYGSGKRLIKPYVVIKYKAYIDGGAGNSKNIGDEL